MYHSGGGSGYRHVVASVETRACAHEHEQNTLTRYVCMYVCVYVCVCAPMDKQVEGLHGVVCGGGARGEWPQSGHLTSGFRN